MRTAAAVLATFAVLVVLAASASADQFVTSVAGVADGPYLPSKDGIAVEREVVPSDLVYSPSGELHFIDWKDDSPRIRKLTADFSRVVTVAGTGSKGFNGDGPALETNINPSEIAFAPNGELFFVDSFRIRKVNHVLGQVQTVAGDGSSSYSRNGAAQKESVSPSELSFSREGELYFIDSAEGQPGASWRIRKLTADGSHLEDVAGGDEGAKPIAKIRPVQLQFSPLGELFFTDEQSRIMKVSSERRAVGLVAGTGALQFNGDGSGRQVNIWPVQMAFATNGELFFIHGSAAIRKVTTDAAHQPVVVTIAQSAMLDSHDPVRSSGPGFSSHTLVAGSQGEMFALSGCGVWGCTRIVSIERRPIDGLTDESYYVFDKLAGTEIAEFNGDGTAEKANINPLEAAISPDRPLAFIDGGGEVGDHRIRILVEEETRGAKVSVVATSSERPALKKSANCDQKTTPDSALRRSPRPLNANVRTKGID